jgi:hypothetical protein
VKGMQKTAAPSSGDGINNNNPLLLLNAKSNLSSLNCLLCHIPLLGLTAWEKNEFFMKILNCVCLPASRHMAAKKKVARTNSFCHFDLLSSVFLVANVSTVTGERQTQPFLCKAEQRELKVEGERELKGTCLLPSPSLKA